MTDLDLNDLAIFVRILQRGGFAPAARDLGVPTSTASRSVARLEEAMGERLLHRTTRSVTPTSEGRALFEAVVESVTSLRGTLRSFEPASRKPKGRLRVTAPNDLGATFLADVAVEFSERYPLVQLDMVLTNRTVNLVEEGFDAAVRAGKLVDSSLVARKVGDVTSALYASPRYLERHPAPQVVADLEQHRVLLFRAKAGELVWSFPTADGAQEQVRVRGPIEGDDFTFIRAAALAGGGIALLPRVSTLEDERAGRLVRVLPGRELPGAPLHVVYPSAKNVPARVTAFRDFVVDSFAERVDAASVHSPPACDRVPPAGGKRIGPAIPRTARDK